MDRLDDTDKNADGYIVELIAIGNSVKVTAFDPETLTEVSVVGSRSTPQKQLSALAVRKLIYMLKKSSSDNM